MTLYTVVFIGKGGYWEGRSGGRQGWFPARAIQEVTDDGDSGVFSEYCKYTYTSNVDTVRSEISMS